MIFIHRAKVVHRKRLVLLLLLNTLSVFVKPCDAQIRN